MGWGRVGGVGSHVGGCVQRATRCGWERFARWAGVCCNRQGAPCNPISMHSPRMLFFYPRRRRIAQVYVTRGAVAALKKVDDPGLRLLGFKPLAALKDYHQLRNPTFVYPGRCVGGEGGDGWFGLPVCLSVRLSCSSKL